MDIICPICGEPVEHDEIHERVSTLGNTTYDEVASDFRKRGCEALGMTHIKDNRPIEAKARAAAAHSIYETLGDDMDGAASAFEDFGLFDS